MKTGKTLISEVKHLIVRNTTGFFMGCFFEDGSHGIYDKDDTHVWVFSLESQADIAKCFDNLLENERN